MDKLKTNRTAQKQDKLRNLLHIILIFKVLIMVKLDMQILSKIVVGKAYLTLILVT